RGCGRSRACTASAVGGRSRVAARGGAAGAAARRGVGNAGGTTRAEVGGGVGGLGPRATAPARGSPRPRVVRRSASPRTGPEIGDGARRQRAAAALAARR